MVTLRRIKQDGNKEKCEGGIINGDHVRRQEERKNTKINEYNTKK